jgi:hypothetical protein
MYEQNEMKCGYEIWLNILPGRYMMYFHLAVLLAKSPCG